MATATETPTKRRTCKGTTRAGKACKAPPLLADDYCSAHTTLLPAGVRFGTSTQAAAAGALGGAAGRQPRVVDVMRDRVEAEIEKVLEPYFNELHDAYTLELSDERDEEGNRKVIAIPDQRRRIRAAEKLLDRAYGKPKQATELSGPEGGPIPTESRDAVTDLAKLSVAEREQLHELHRKMAA